MTGFVQISNALLTHYVFYPKFNGNTYMVYAYLTKLDNAEWGYAFPKQTQVISDLGISDSTFSSAVKTLESCGLITVGKRKNGPITNNVYYVNDPIEDKAEFFAKYPEALAVYEAKQATAQKVGKRKADDKQALIVAQNDDNIADWL